MTLEWKERAGMLTRPEVDEAEAKANSHEAETEAEANIALFFSQILHFDPIFSKNRNVWSIFEGTSKILDQKGP